MVFGSAAGRRYVTSMNADPGKRTQRLASLDAYRGFVMLLMMAEVLRLCAVSAALPDSGFWRFLCHHQSHVPWVGCSLHDLIQPAFYFLVGAVLPFSIASRRARGQSFAALTRHAAVRVAVLVVLGMAVWDIHAQADVFNFVDTLAQIGLGYGFLFMLGFRPVRDWCFALALVLTGYWIAFVLYPSPQPDFDFAEVGVTAHWLSQHGLTGLAAHWQKNSNLGWAFDVWFLNLFPRPTPFRYYPSGLATLNFIPTIGTMILGLIAGNTLRDENDPWRKVRWFVIAGVVGLTGGWGLGALGICPVVKAIWTPSWVLFSGGWCFLFLAGFYSLVEIWGQKRVAFPLVVIGMNSILAYCGAHFYQAYAFGGLRRIFGREVFRLFGDAHEPLVYGLAVLFMFWLGLYVMYRRKLFLRI
jgi:heparan-alpha-glucosaminide N-acetyltransferase